MATVTNDLSDLKRLLVSNDSSLYMESEVRPSDETPYGPKPESGDSALHSYIRSIIDGSEVYDIMKDTDVYGVSFTSLAAACDDGLSKDIVEYFACCFFEGDYSWLDTIVVQCERGNRTEPSAKASVLGHVVSMTYRQEFELLAELYSIALLLDRRMDDSPEKIVITYHRSRKKDEGRGYEVASQAATKDSARQIDKGYGPVFSSREHELGKALSAPIKKKHKPQTAPAYPKVTIRTPNIRKITHHAIISSPSMKRRSFTDHVAISGVWGKIAAFGGFNGRLIYINAGHSR